MNIHMDTNKTLQKLQKVYMNMNCCFKSLHIFISVKDISVISKKIKPKFI